MTITMLDKPGRDRTHTRDQLGVEDSVRTFLIAEYDEKVIIEQNASKIVEQGIGDAFILGHPTNGKMGVANGVGGGQITLGSGDMDAEVLVRVVSPNNLFREHIVDTEFYNTTDTDANIDTTNQKLSFE